VTPIQAFYAIDEAKKAPADRVYHNNSACRTGQDIPPGERRSGTNDYRQCDECANLTRHPGLGQQPSSPND
jgi:hypothetical protein